MIIDLETRRNASLVRVPNQRQWAESCDPHVPLLQVVPVTQQSYTSYREEAMRMKKLFASGLSLMIAVLFVVALGSSSASAQTGSGSIRGTVKDPQGNTVAGAKITLRNDEKNFSRDQVTDNDGNYTFTSVPPDTYVLDAEAPNFKKAVISGVKALADKSNRVDVNLEIGAVTETVNVVAGGVDSLVNTQDASLGNNFVSQQILQLRSE